MPSGRTSIGKVADSLGTNVRTLQRQLEQESTNFSELLDRVRTQQLAQHFGNRQLRLTDVAHLLGYAELASFSAWYRSKFHSTPTQGRRNLRKSIEAKR
jgi:AraC-like DNA-binding protein